jgi:hypothetical protein
MRAPAVGNVAGKGRSLSRATLDYLRWHNITRAQWVAHYGWQGQWWGDRCGCFDDRCIGYHHDAGQDCHCIDAMIRDLLAERVGNVA